MSHPSQLRPRGDEETREREEMMMIGRGISHLKPMVLVPPWSTIDDTTAGSSAASPLPVSGVSAGNSIVLDETTLAALQLYLGREEAAAEAAAAGEEMPSVVDAYASDEFRMYEFKVRRCARPRAHDWTECPFAHPGEKARRRDPRKYRYSGTPCPDFRKAGGCKRGDACEFSHGVFECWLHPDRYRTQPCKDGTDCRRRVCFFAHTPDQLRVQIPSAAVADSYDGSPLRQQASQSHLSKSVVSSPTSTLIPPPKSPPTDSPPKSPSGAKLRRASWPVGSSLNEVVASLRQLQLSRADSMPSSWGFNGGFVSPKGAALSGLNTGFCSLPSTPTAAASCLEEGEPVESGRALRAKMFERLSKKDTIYDGAEATPNVDWVSELLK